MRFVHGVVMVVAGGLMAACSASTAGPPIVTGSTPFVTATTAPATASAAIPVAPQPPSKLVGAWAVEAPGVAEGAVLRITDNASEEDGGGMTLALPPSCWLGLSYLATKPNLLVMSGTSGSGACGDLEGPNFVSATRTFAADAGGVALLDRSGAVVARLTPGATPPENPNARPESSAVPKLSSEGAAALDAATVLPAGLRLANRDELVGEWIPEATTNPGARLRLREDGRYSAYGGSCNGLGGTWTAAEGVLLATFGNSTVVGCDNDPRPESVPGIKSATFDDDVLVISDQQGKLVARFLRAAPTPEATST